MRLKLYKNGAVIYQSFNDHGGGGDAGSTREENNSIIGMIDLDDDDYIEAYIHVNFQDAGAFNLQGGTTYNRFGAFRIAGV